MNSKCKIQKIILSFSTVGTAVSGEHLTVHVYANSDSEKLLVGRLDLVGKTQSTFNKSLTIVYPAGYGLTANLVDSYGLPFNDGREVVITIDADKSDATNSEQVGEMFINNAFISDGVIHTANYIASMGISVKSNSELTTREKLSAIVSRYMAGEASEFTDELVSEVMGLFDKTETRRLIDSCIEESIRLNCRPGGAIWQAIRGR